MKTNGRVCATAPRTMKKTKKTDSSKRNETHRFKLAAIFWISTTLIN